MALERPLMRLSLHERFGEFLLSRTQGEDIRAIVVGALQRGEEVVFDFAGVHSAIASFLNPAFGELYEQFPIAFVDETVSLVNASPAIAEMWNLVRENSIRFYHDPDYRAQLERAADELFL